MGKKKMMKLPFLSQSKSLDSNLPSSSSSSSSFSSSPSWPFPSCGNIRTLSFRAKDDNNNNNNGDDDAFRTFNSVFLETEFTPSESSRTFSTLSEDSGDPIESVIRGLRSSERLFFEPERSSSLLLRSPQEKTEEEEEMVVVAYNESEVLSMDSNSPYEDFRRSMEEMVEAHGLKDWKGLEELLGCYLKINGDTNHGYIVGAFIDLLVSISFASFQSTSSSTSTTTTATINTTATAITTTTTTSSSYSNYSSPSSPLSLPSSSLTTPCVSSMLDHDDDDDDDGGDGHGHGHDDDHQPV